MLKLFGIALGAGATSAILVATAGTQTAAGLVLAQLAPLPLMIVGFGFPPAVGAVAALVGASGVGAAGHPIQALAFLAFPALPSWLLAVLAARPRVRPAEADAVGWLPIGTLALVLAAASALPVLLLGAAAMWRLGGYEPALDRAANFTSALLSGRRLPQGITARDLAQVVPVAMALGGTLVLAGNLWLAARSAQLSGWLARSWPDIPAELRLPRAAFGALAVIGAAVLLPDPFGLAAAVTVGALGVAFAFEGLALTHLLTRGLRVRYALLAGVYLAVLLVEPWPLLALVLAGCVDCLVPQLRRGAAVKVTRLPKRRR